MSGKMLIQPRVVGGRVIFLGGGNQGITLEIPPPSQENSEKQGGGYLDELFKTFLGAPPPRIPL